MTLKRFALLASFLALVGTSWPSTAAAQVILGPWGGYQYPYRFDPGASVRLEVKPNNAEVYVDGYYAGIVDDFDGTFQRLAVLPGEHEIELYLEGYRPWRQRIYLQPRRTFKIKETLQRLASGEAPAERPQPVNPPQMQPGGPGQPYPMPPQGRGPAGGGRRGPQGPPPGPQQMPPQQLPPDATRGTESSARGTLSLRVQPGDAEVLIDGERKQAPGNQGPLVVELSEGRHTIEVRKPGYVGYVTDVQLRRGETTPLNVNLRQQE